MQYRMLPTVFLLASLGLVVACSSAPSQPSLVPATAVSASPLPAGRANPGRAGIKQHLLQHYEGWRGTPYRYGGGSRQGIDCSGFVQLTFRRVLGIELPRTAAQQAQVGRRIAARQLAAGDLLFFDTGQRHVGIYLANGKFMHASASRGVTTSSMRSPYWARTFRHSRRVAAR